MRITIVVRVLGTLLCLQSVNALAIDRPEEGPPATAASPASEGFLLGDDLRYDRAWLPTRAFADLIAIPASMPRWSSAEWGLFLATTTTVAGLMFPSGPQSPDVLLQNWVRTNTEAWRRYVWTPVTEVVVWGAVWSGIGVMFLNGEKELVSLMIEAFSVAQLYQLVFKLSLGREGPMNNEGNGIIHGPSMGYRLFPAGTPSGHAASFFALMGTLDAFRGHPVLTGVFSMVGLVFAASLVVSDYHYISDVVWGAIMGVSIGHWVVKHRSTIQRPGGRSPAPQVTPPTLLPTLQLNRDRWSVGVAARF